MAEVKFDDRVAVVTGAGGGLGKAYAMLLASRGAKVVVNDLGGSFDGVGADTRAAQLVVDEIKAAGGEATPNYDSVSDWESAQAIIQTAIDAYGRIDILINNAGILRDKSLLKMTIEDYKLVMAVHMDGTFYCTKAALPHMREAAYGRIVSTASGTGVYGNFGQANYGAAKMGIVGFTNCVKQEGAKYNILANVIVPQAGTRMTATVLPPNIIDKLKPEYVAPMVCWLASDHCDVSGMYFMAGAGYFSRSAIVEGPGVFLDPDKEITIEDVEANIEKIKSLEGGRGYGSVTEQTGYVLSNLKLD
ncbi:MAG: SDR family oxidoreductase [Actinomycetota bacterium]|nr:SDR family oxidoreductase [Actinomycetota bacterium]MDD5667388.1 SDR family oxidoreductase [Actinomycetota bacterium]